MSDVKNFLRDVGYFSVGAAAVIMEAGGKTVKALVRKGEKTLRENQDTVDELKRKARNAGEKLKDAAQKAVAKSESASKDAAAPMDTSAMSAEERAELHRQLDEADAAEPQPTAPDAIYRTEEPAPAEEPKENEAPENSING